jgi:hypothetical protein
MLGRRSRATGMQARLGSAGEFPERNNPTSGPTSAASGTSLDGPAMAPVLSFAAFLPGAAALLFEALERNRFKRVSCLEEGAVERWRR